MSLRRRPDAGPTPERPASLAARLDEAASHARALSAAYDAELRASTAGDGCDRGRSRTGAGHAIPHAWKLLPPRPAINTPMTRVDFRHEVADVGVKTKPTVKRTQDQGLATRRSRSDISKATSRSKRLFRAYMLADPPQESGSYASQPRGYVRTYNMALTWIEEPTNSTAYRPSTKDAFAAIRQVVMMHLNEPSKNQYTSLILVEADENPASFDNTAFEVGFVDGDDNSKICDEIVARVKTKLVFPFDYMHNIASRIPGRLYLFSVQSYQNATEIARQFNNEYPENRQVEMALNYFSQKAETMPSQGPSTSENTLVQYDEPLIISFKNVQEDMEDPSKHFVKWALWKKNGDGTLAAMVNYRNLLLDQPRQQHSGTVAMYNEFFKSLFTPPMQIRGREYVRLADEIEPKDAPPSNPPSRLSSFLTSVFGS